MPTNDPLPTDRASGPLLRTPSETFQPASTGADSTVTQFPNLAPSGSNPTTLAPYVPIREIGIGGMGVVLEADDPLVGRRVAIKRMRPELAASPEAKERFLREARAMGAVSHDNVVPIYHVGEDSHGVPFIVMPLLKGETLADRLKRDGKLRVGDLLAIGQGIAKGLAAAHATGLIHRDIKPANVWLESTANGVRVKLLDFGLARAADAGDGPTRTGGVVGTPAYMSPEQADGLTLDHRADLFSLGVVLYHTATAVSPFRRDTTTATLNAVANYTPVDVAALNEVVPPGVSNLIGQLMAKRPADRPTGAEHVARELEQCVRDLVESATVAWPTARVKGGVRHRRLLPFASAISLAIVALLLIVAFWPKRTINLRFESKSVVKLTGQKFSDLTDPATRPLKAGDVVKLSIKLDRPAFVYLLVINDLGEITTRSDLTGERAATDVHPDVPLPGGSPRLLTIAILVRRSPIDGAKVPERLEHLTAMSSTELKGLGVQETRNGVVEGTSRSVNVSLDAYKTTLEWLKALRADGVCDEFLTLSIPINVD